MVARLAKRLNSDRRRAMPVGPIHEKLDELGVAEARAVLIAPSEASHLPRYAGKPEPLGNEIDRLFASLEAVTPENHPRTARLLGVEQPEGGAKSHRGGGRGRACSRQAQ